MYLLAAQKENAKKKRKKKSGIDGVKKKKKKHSIKALFRNYSKWVCNYLSRWSQILKLKTAFYFSGTTHPSKREFNYQRTI